MWLLFIFSKKKKKLTDWAVFVRMHVCYSVCLFTKNLSPILFIVSLCGFHNLIHTHSTHQHTNTRTRANAYQLTRWWMHNYERVCEEKLISKHKFIAINLSIDGNRIATTCTTNAATVNCFLQLLLLFSARGEKKTTMLATISEYDYN